MVSDDHALVTSYTWAQVVAWAGGSVLWIVVVFISWLVGGRHDQPQPIAEIPGDTSRRKLTPPLIVFAVIRALVMAGTVALAFGADLSHGYWMPIAVRNRDRRAAGATPCDGPAIPSSGR